MLTAYDYRHTVNSVLPVPPVSLARHQSQDDVMTPTRRQQGGSRAFRPFLHIAGPLWGPSSNSPLCG